MKKLCLLVTLCVLLGYAMADDCGWPYNCVGTIAPTMTITAHGTGSIAGQFVGFQAHFTDWIQVIDTTSNWSSGWVFPNQTTAPNTPIIFGNANKGDNLVVEICAVPDWLGNQTCDTENPLVRVFASDPSKSFDGQNHAYFYKNTLNPFVEIGMEDLAADWNTDWDYNDHEFFLYNVDIAQGSNAATPEPASLVLLGSAVMAAVRKTRKAKS